MKLIRTLGYAPLLAALIAWAPLAPAQETEAPTEAELEASAAAAAAGEAAEREEEESSSRRRRGPVETKIDLGDEQAIRVTNTQWPVDGPDYPKVAELKSSEVLLMTASSPPKLWTHADLTFGEVTVKAGNVAENYPGVYGLWLRKTENGWNLIFNNKPDVWGTMYDPAADAGEIPIEYTKTDTPAETFTVTLTETSEGAGTLTMAWGEHRWSTSFTYGG